MMNVYVLTYYVDATDDWDWGILGIYADKDGAEIERQRLADAETWFSKTYHVEEWSVK